MLVHSDIDLAPLDRTYRKAGEVKASSRQSTPEASELSILQLELYSLKIEEKLVAEGVNVSLWKVKQANALTSHAET